MRYPFTLFVVAIAAVAASPAPPSPDYAKLIVGYWRVHAAGHADRIVVFHSDGKCDGRNWDLSQSEDIRGHRWRLAGDRLIFTVIEPSAGIATNIEKIVLFSRDRFVTQIGSRRFYYTRIKHWRPSFA
jgi:hypothetical protein